MYYYSVREFQEMIDKVEATKDREIDYISISNNNILTKDTAIYNRQLLNTFILGMEDISIEDATIWSDKLYRRINLLLNSNLKAFQIKSHRATNISDVYISPTYKKTPKKGLYQYTYQIPVEGLVERLILAVNSIATTKISGVYYIDHDLTHKCIEKGIPMQKVTHVRDEVRIPTALCGLLSVLDRLNGNSFALDLLMYAPSEKLIYNKGI